MSSTTNGGLVSVTTANSYISDFIEDYFTTGKSPVKSMIMSADLIKDYLNNNSSIENVKFVLGAKDSSLTLIIAGYDAEGNYVLPTDGMILDNTSPCPSACPTFGQAANDLITIPVPPPDEEPILG